MTLTKKQEDILLHMTGLDRSKVSYRTHYAIGPESQGTSAWNALVSMQTLGLVHPPVAGGETFGNMWFFQATPEGVKVAKALRAQRLREE